MPVYNGGGGGVVLTGADVIMDSDAALGWLQADLRAPTIPKSDINASHVEIRVVRQVLPLTPSRYTGTVRIHDASGVVGNIRVMVYVSEFARAGFDLTLVATEEATGIVRRSAAASADRGYRYWLRNLMNGDYRIKAGEDRDGNGLFCQEGDSCGWYGGPTEPDSILVPFEGETPATNGLDIFVVPQAP